jgi:hypothetical protein
VARRASWWMASASSMGQIPSSSISCRIISVVTRTPR